MKTIVLSVAAFLVFGVSSCKPHTRRAEASTSNGETTISRNVATPSGDWSGRIDYTYGEGGLLRRASYVLRTFHGYDSATEEFSATECIREYRVAPDGILVEKSRITKDLSSGELVERIFYEPAIGHWRTLAMAVNEMRKEPSPSDHP